MKTETMNKEETTMAFRGDKGGEKGGGYISVGVYTGNLWKMAADEWKHYKQLSGGMSRVMALTYDIPMELMDLVFSAPYELEDKGLHVIVDFGDEETLKRVSKAMKLQRKLREALAELNCEPHMIDGIESERRRMKDAIEGSSWLLNCLVDKDDEYIFHSKHGGSLKEDALCVMEQLFEAADIEMSHWSDEE
jgi:hypothetical protein